MSKLLYNGVELPAVPAHDADATVEVISAVLPAALSMYAQSPYILVIGKGTLWQGGKCYVRGVSAVYRLSGDAWLWHYGSGTVSTQDIVAANYFEAIWTNTDIPTADGAGKYLAASAPVDPDAPDEPEPEEPPVEPNVDVAAIYRRGWMDGFLSGINIRGILRRRKVEEPQPVTAYLYGIPSPTIVTYNGVELPDIETVWTDKTTYPFAFVYSFTSNGVANYILMLLPQVPYVGYLSSSTVRLDGCAVSATPHLKQYKSVEGAWVDQNFGYATASLEYYPASTPILWASGDLAKQDGTVYLAASEPVMVGANLTVIRDEGDATYRGAVLPPLPDYDKTAYPYAVIINFAGSLRLFVYSNPAKLEEETDGQYTLRMAEAGNWRRYDFSNDPWSVWKWSSIMHREDSTGVFANLSDPATNLLWSNSVVEYEDGNICRMPYYPVPVSCRYNGVELPVATEHSNYPYLLIREKIENSNFVGHELWMMKSKIYPEYSSVYNKDFPKYTGEYIIMFCPVGGTEWILDTSGSVTDSTMTGIIWINHDVIGTDGVTLVETASEPTFVFEKGAEIMNIIDINAAVQKALPVRLDLTQFECVVDGANATFNDVLALMMTESIESNGTLQSAIVTDVDGKLKKAASNKKDSVPIIRSVLGTTFNDMPTMRAFEDGSVVQLSASLSFRNVEIGTVDGFAIIQFGSTAQTSLRVKAAVVGA